MIIDAQFLRQIREHELAHIIHHMPPGASVLDLGAGAGWQARMLSDQGFQVVAVDVQECAYTGDRVWPVIPYDGKTLPFSACRFDVVFSSNVLEHVDDLPAIIDEMKRVLKPDGIVIAILPSGTWRLWTSATFYPWLVKVLARSVFRRSSSHSQSESSEFTFRQARAKASWSTLVKSALFPPRHGVRGNSLTELFTFSRIWWTRTLKRHGLTCRFHSPLRLFYTGYLLAGARLDLPTRGRMSHLLGSSSAMYVMKPDASQPAR